jgi:hypothetical protein
MVPVVWAPGKLDRLPGVWNPCWNCWTSQLRRLDPPPSGPSCRPSRFYFLVLRPSMAKDEARNRVWLSAVKEQVPKEEARDEGASAAMMLWS